MLELQRASAGSGKTYMLAKRFIWYFITISEEGGRRRLRTKAELNDSLSHILAVTFTNKATNEMQERIVEKLYALGNQTTGKRPDYLDDFLKELNDTASESVTEEEIRETCRTAVGVLLNNYSDFNVSTIDSFFQQVLRTFAYESDLSDSYHIELDGRHLSNMAIDSLLEDINTGKASPQLTFWINELMTRGRENGGRWNIFAKRDVKGDPYNFLTESVNRLENEDFKNIRREIDAYFEGREDFHLLYKSLKEKYETPVRKVYKDVLSKMKRFQEGFRRYGGRLDPKDAKTFEWALKKFNGSGGILTPLKDSSSKTVEEFKRDFTNAYYNRKSKGDTEAYQAVEDLYLEMSESFDKWMESLQKREYRHWQLYSENIPFMGLLQEIREKRDEYLRENNAIELGETNAILHDIIGEDDAPFIYERIGTRLNHFLIDEFQDTSNMQWRNMSPLLHESIGRGNENLIIGDAKQSIYRFRNADSTLIAKSVPEEFGLNPAEDSGAMNTNWRSDRRIVEFNNKFFDFLSEELNRLVGYEISENRRDFRRDYQNVKQEPHHKEAAGYVEVRMDPKEGIKWSEYVLQSLPELIEDVVSRGFRMRDIAILVDRNSQGEAVIGALTEHNAQLSPGERGIEYVSEQSLKLTSSPAISLVVSVLETICRGADPKVRNGEERVKKGVADWGEVACNFRFYALRHPELSTPDCLMRFFEQGGDNHAIEEMLVKMQAVTLPALVESIIAEFISVEVRKRDAVFLAAFQDMVLEYCDSHPSDLASFLKWWDDKKWGASITSPEDMDAVTVMTVHKSKGLEFPVVIVPFANASFKDDGDKAEWRWVKPEGISSEEYELPPYLPIATDKKAEKTSHERLLLEFYDLKKMDTLNSLYVAFTRAANELYIYSEPGRGKTRDPFRMSVILDTFFTKFRSEDNAVFNDGQSFTFGAKYGSYSPDEKSRDVRERVLEDYTARPTPDFLLYRVEEAPEVVDADDPELSEEEDPRSEGDLLHDIMQEVNVREDIPRAVRRKVLTGIISREEGKLFTAMLMMKTEDARVRSWFEKGWRVLNERPLLRSGSIMKRPDRVLVSPQGDAVVIDYKFGESMATHKRYCRQVYDYVETLKDTGRFRSVTGYLWYVKMDKVELVAR